MARLDGHAPSESPEVCERLVQDMKWRSFRWTWPDETVGVWAYRIIGFVTAVASGLLIWKRGWILGRFGSGFDNDTTLAGPLLLFGLGVLIFVSARRIATTKRQTWKRICFAYFAGTCASVLVLLLPFFLLERSMVRLVVNLLISPIIHTQLCVRLMASLVTAGRYPPFHQVSVWAVAVSVAVFLLVNAYLRRRESKAASQLKAGQ